jgi:hypothetical protein
VLRRMMTNQNVEPNVTTYNSVINAYANRGHFQVRHEPHTCIHTRGEAAWGRLVYVRCMWIPDVHVRACVRVCVCVQGAEDVLQHMNAANVQPNMTTYNSLIDAYAAGGNSEVRLVCCLPVWL